MSTQPDNQHAPATPSDDLDISFDALRDGEMDVDQKAKLQSIVEQEEKSTRTLALPWQYLVSTLAISMSGFYIYTAGTLPAPVQWQRGIYIMLTYILIFLLYPMVSSRSSLGA